ncbi:MAG TPA: hypothetical protein VGR02_14215 [Thermoanaerobaculia bacterium]|jgi:hypothetical protein|nr:hypothetical protein [Thermoanaerobaculia bacterium]
MTQDTPTPGGFGASSGSDLGGGSTGIGNNTGSSSFGATNTGADICPTCGQSKNRGLEQFLGRIGISEEMINNLKNSMQSVDVDEYLNTARDYLKTGSTKATSYAKENPGTVAAGVAVLAVGAGLLIRALNKE